MFLGLCHIQYAQQASQLALKDAGDNGLVEAIRIWEGLQLHLVIVNKGYDK